MKKKMKLSKRLEFYLRFIYIYLIIIFIGGCVGLIYNVSWAILSFATFVIMLGVTIWFNKITRKAIISYINDYAIDFSVIQKNLIKNLSLPYVLVDLHGSIRWYNDEFKEIFPDEIIRGKNLHTLITEFHVDGFPKDGTSVQKDILIGDKYFLAEINLIEIEGEKSDDNDTDLFKDQTHYYAITLTDISQLIELKQEIIDQRTIISLVFIDNYEEVMQSIDEVRRPLLDAMIYRKLNEFVLDLEGVVRKFEKDKYICMYPNKSLTILQDNKFQFLDEIRKINIGNDLPVTASIGVGIHSGNLTESMEFSRAAIDLALGRGGDQAVIKNQDRYLFYGGRTNGVEKSTRVKARIKAYAFRELIEEADRVLIMGHVSPDIDAFGAALGVYRGATLLDKPAHIVLNDHYPAIANIYHKILEEKELDEGVIVSSDEAIELSGERTLVVVVDVNRPSRVECKELLELNKNIVVFDHHRTSVEDIKNAVISYVEPYASSTSEMITEILQYMIDKVKLRPFEADALFAGITVDTKNFTVKSGVRTFEAAAFLRRHGADSIRVRRMFKNDMSSYRLRTSIVADAEIYMDKIAISECYSDVDNVSVIVAQAADELLDISGVQASFVLTKIEDTIVISARSLGAVNVQVIMEHLGGGGHLTVAGAQLEGVDISTVKSQLKSIIYDQLKEDE